MTLTRRHAVLAAASLSVAAPALLRAPTSSAEGYHMPAPGLGFVEARDDGFRWVPASYQFM